MGSEQEKIKQSIDGLGEKLGGEKKEKMKKIGEQAGEIGVPQDWFGMSDAMIEGIYGQAYRLFNTGKYKDAIQLFRTLVMMNPAEPKYVMGMAACCHMLKDYTRAIDQYAYCSIIDGESPVPYYHASDCYIQMGDKASAAIALDMAVKRAGDKPEFAVMKDRAAMTLESIRNELRK